MTEAGEESKHRSDRRISGGMGRAKSRWTTAGQAPSIRTRMKPKSSGNLWNNLLLVLALISALLTVLL
ncbi:MAG TPA: hypothetical protein P5022_16560, partial [Candidatus Paceibacterota bacterium]|nr:hypothetical protein [Candidatus Paceibacterota bacterium]